MKKNIIFSVVTTVLGLLTAIGPKYIFKACPSGCCCAAPDCHWALQAELGMGMVIAALGIFFIIYNDPKIQQGMTIGMFLTGVMVILIPNLIMGGCAIKSMECNILTYPILTVLGILVTVLSGIKFLSLRKTKRQG